MNIERFRARTIAEALTEVKRELGEDAIVLQTAGRDGVVEVTATTAVELFRFGAALRSEATAASRKRRARVIGLIGPTGSGKTTTAVKLILSERGFAGSRVGLLSLDTYKIGAQEQVQVYADLAHFPLDVVASPKDARRALARMSECDVVIVDTPGRSPGAEDGDRGWWASFLELAPDEVHFVLPASVRPDVAKAWLAHHRPLGPTHVLLTKLDEVPEEGGVAEMAYALGLSARWICDGQDVPEDLHAAHERLVAALLGGSPRAWKLETVA